MGLPGTKIEDQEARVPRPSISLSFYSSLTSCFILCKILGESIQVHKIHTYASNITILNLRENLLILSGILKHIHTFHDSIQCCFCCGSLYGKTFRVIYTHEQDTKMDITFNWTVKIYCKFVWLDYMICYIYTNVVFI